MIDGIKKEYETRIIEILGANPRVERAVLFGSRAIGDYTDTSDIDLALYGDDLTLDDLANLIEEIEELTLPQRVDLLLVHRIENKQLVEHIQKYGVEVYQRNESSTIPRFN